MIQLDNLTAEEFTKFARLAQDQAGIHVSEEKRLLLSNRLRRRLRVLEMQTFAEYYAALRDPQFAKEELPHFLTVITTNETYFFRNPQLWQTLQNRVIPQRVASKGPRCEFKLWSAASSSGEEAYTAAIVLRESLPNWSRWQVSIVGTDISSKMLEHAQRAVYGDYALAHTPPELRRRWFTTTDDGKHRLHEDLRRLVRFMFHNLRDPFPLSGFDLVLLRNVLMYFDTPMKVRVLDVVSRAVAPGGYLYVGDVDPIRACAALSKALPLLPLSPGLYHKPTATAAQGIPT